MIDFILVDTGDNFSSDDFQKASQFLSAYRQNRIEITAIHADKLLSMAGELALSVLLKRHKQVDLSKCTFHFSPHGKPFLHEVDDFDFSISHSGKYAVCAVSDKQIGIDIQKPVYISISVAKRFFSEAEYQILKPMPQDKFNLAFAKLWTLKESIVKCQGESMALMMKQYCFSLQNDIFIPKFESTNPLFFDTLVLEDYVLSFCTSEAFKLGNTPIITLKDLLDTINNI